jgi:hypothetical protein
LESTANRSGRAVAEFPKNSAVVDLAKDPDLREGFSNTSRLGRDPAWWGRSSSCPDEALVSGATGCLSASAVVCLHLARPLRFQAMHRGEFFGRMLYKVRFKESTG